MECPLPRGATFGVPWEPLACAAAVAMRVPLSCPAGPQAMTRALWEAAAQFPLRQIEVEQTYRDARGHWAGFRRLGNTHHRLLEILCTWAERRSGRHCHYSMPQIAALLGVNRRWAKRVVRDLEATGLIFVRRGGGRGVANEYFVRQELVRKPTLVFGDNGGRLRVEMVAGIPTPVLGRPATVASENGGAPAGHPTPDVSPGVRRAPAGARDGTRFASPAGSARDDLLSSRASLGPGNGEMTDAVPAPGRGQPAVDYRRWEYTRSAPDDPCPVCGRKYEGAYKDHVCWVKRPKSATPSESESPTLPLLSEPELRAEHERLLALERARTEVADA